MGALDEINFFGTPVVICYMCGWGKGDPTHVLQEEHLRMIAVLHTIHRHPEVWQEATGKSLKEGMKEYGELLSDPAILREI